MDSSGVLKACIRRWYVVLPILLITAWYAYSSYTAVKPVYYANAVVGATSANLQMTFNPNGTPIPRNGLLEVGGANLIMNMVVLGFDDPTVRARVVDEGGKGNFTVRMFPAPASAGPQAPLPLVMIEATEPEAASATRTVELAASQADVILGQIQQQAGVPDSVMLKAIKVSSPKALAGTPSRNKSTLVVLALGAGVAVLAAVILETSIVKWRERRHSKAKSATSELDGEKVPS